VGDFGGLPKFGLAPRRKEMLNGYKWLGRVQKKGQKAERGGYGKPCDGGL